MVSCFAIFVESFSTIRGRSPFPPGVLRWGHTKSKSKDLSDTLSALEGFEEPTLFDLKDPPVHGDPTSWKVINKYDDEQARSIKQYWTADAWSESLPDGVVWFLTVIYELLPPPIGGLTCWLIDGKTSAQNRRLLPSSAPGGGKLPGVLVAGIQFQLVPVVFFVIWFIYQPEEIVALQLVLPALLYIYRSMSLGAKYSYFALSDLEIIRRSVLWSGSKHAQRVLGIHKFFDLLSIDSHHLDFIEQIFASAVRNSLLDEVRHCYLTVSKSVAEEVWNCVGPILATVNERGKSGVFHDTILFESRYGEIAEILGLDHVNDVDQLAGIQQGQLRVSLLAFYFLVKNVRPYSKHFVILLMMTALSFAFVHPVVLALTGKRPFGSSPEATCLYILRSFISFALGFPCFMFFTYPTLDTINRLKMSHSILASFQCGESLALELMLGVHNAAMPINTNADLQAFWVLSRVLGPSYDIGTSTRYNSAFVLVQVILLLVATSAMRFSQDRYDEVQWGVVVEFMIMFALGAAAVFLASLLSLRLNNHAPLYIQVARSACLNRPELGASAKDVCSHIQMERMVLHPVSIMYMPADPKLVSFLWTGLVVLAAVFAGALPNVEIPGPF